MKLTTVQLATDKLAKLSNWQLSRDQQLPDTQLFESHLKNSGCKLLSTTRKWAPFKEVKENISLRAFVSNSLVLSKTRGQFNKTILRVSLQQMDYVAEDIK